MSIFFSNVNDVALGRPDKDKAVHLASSGSSRVSLPKLKDVRRSWHGMSRSLRESMRSTRENILNRSSTTVHNPNTSTNNPDISLRQSKLDMLRQRFQRQRSTSSPQKTPQLKRARSSHKETPV